MQRLPFWSLTRALRRPILHLLGAPARALTRWSDEADDVWEPFLDDPAPAPDHRLAA